MRKYLNFALIVLSIFAFRWSLVDHYRVPSESMYPAVEIGDDLLVLKAQYKLKLPFTDKVLWEISSVERGDVIVFNAPHNGINFLKRVVALPGDKVKISSQGEVFINEQSQGLVPDLVLAQEVFYEEQIGMSKIKIRRYPEVMQPHDLFFELKDQEYLVLGDNRDNSYDSRFFGVVNYSLIKGKAHFVLWNFSLNNPFPYFKFFRTGKSLY